MVIIINISIPCGNANNHVDIFQNAADQAKYLKAGINKKIYAYLNAFLIWWRILAMY